MGTRLPCNDWVFWYASLGELRGYWYALDHLHWARPIIIHPLSLKPRFLPHASCLIPPPSPSKISLSLSLFHFPPTASRPSILSLSLLFPSPQSPTFLFLFLQISNVASCLLTCSFLPARFCFPFPTLRNPLLETTPSHVPIHPLQTRRT